MSRDGQKRSSQQQASTSNSGPDRFGMPSLGNAVASSLSAELGIESFTRGNWQRTASPWTNDPEPKEVPMVVPQCFQDLKYEVPPGHYSNASVWTLFFIFYNMPRDVTQLCAAQELCDRGWFFHKTMKLWLCRMETMPYMRVQGYERARYLAFDPTMWKITKGEEDIVVCLQDVEQQPKDMQKR